LLNKTFSVVIVVCAPVWIVIRFYNAFAALARSLCSMLMIQRESMLGGYPVSADPPCTAYAASILVFVSAVVLSSTHDRAGAVWLIPF